MAPANQVGKRNKGTQVIRPFIVGSTAVPFNETTNPKPAGVPDNHTHSWRVFVKGLEDTDITYWVRRIQFKLHESIPNHVRMVEGQPGKPFEVSDTGWGEFEVAVKLYYINESGEKPQTLYHYLRLHPYGRTEEEKQQMIMENGEVISWAYEEQLFNEPFDAFFRILTSGAVPKNWKPAGGKGKGKGKGRQAAPPPLPDPDSGEVWERTALIPQSNRPGEPFSRETEAAEAKKIADAIEKVKKMTEQHLAENVEKEQRLADMKAKRIEMEKQLEEREKAAADAAGVP